MLFPVLVGGKSGLMGKVQGPPIVSHHNDDDDWDAGMCRIDSKVCCHHVLSPWY